jgi:superfamily II DNA or RNA helicase
MITLKQYQEATAGNALDLFRYVGEQLAQVAKPEERAAVVAHNGGVLLKAPTGSGKTLIAGEIVQSLSRDLKVVWFWFAPFKGLVGQTESSLREKYPTLRMRDLRDDRQAAGTRSGDVWVSTWQSVAARDTDARKIRSASESNLSIDTLLLRLREMEFHIGVVVDEAHHGFGHGTQALDFYSQHLRPEFTLLLTATPDDTDAEAFKRAAGFKRLHTITISRIDAVAAGLVKPGIRSIAFVAAQDQEAIVDFETTALREGTSMHQAIKAGLQAVGVELVPLMLVQVDSSKDSVERVRGKLLELGFSDDQIAAHTAAEPDGNLLALAVDETKEVLIFKMAVALGFDAPRAFTLVSMRGIVDEDFGTQIVGRIMRVHRRCQGMNLPPLLQNSYVFLADCEGQAGISTAAQKLNRLKTELAQVSPYAVVVQIGGENQLQILKDGQTFLLPGERQLPQQHEEGIGFESVGAEPNQVQLPRKQPDWLGLFSDVLEGGESGESSKPSGPVLAPYSYKLKEGVPRDFLTQRMMLGVDEEGLAGAIAKNIVLTNDVLMDGMRRAVSVIRVDQAVFSLQEEKRERIMAEMAIRETERQAQRMLFDMGTVDPRDLQEGLLQRLKREYEKLGQAIAENEEQLECALSLILVQHPKLLREARKSCEARYTEIVKTDPLPTEIYSDQPLDRSPKNVYGVYPADLNNWEKPFAELLDNAEDGVVDWWHRNPPHKPWSVAVTLTNGKQFFPDFLVGVSGRSTPNGVLLVDTKRAINDDTNSLIKSVSEHKSYGRTAILFYEDEKRWKVVRYNEEKDKNEIAELFDLRAAKEFATH